MLKQLLLFLSFKMVILMHSIRIYNTELNAIITAKSPFCIHF